MACLLGVIFIRLHVLEIGILMPKEYSKSISHYQYFFLWGSRLEKSIEEEGILKIEHLYVFFFVQTLEKYVIIGGPENKAWKRTASLD